MKNTSNGFTLKKNDQIQLEITGISTDGTGIGRYNGQAVFVPLTDIGELVDVLIIKVTKKYAVGKLVEILRASESRCDPECEQYARCGGCCFRHITYAQELERKRQYVIDNLRRIGKLDIAVAPVIPSTSATRYRNKAQYPVQIGKDGELNIGFYAKHSHRVIPADDCALQPEIFSEVVAAIKKFLAPLRPSVYDEMTHTGELRHIYLRLAKQTGEVMVCLIANAKKLPYADDLAAFLIARFPQIKSVILNINQTPGNTILGKECRVIWGKPYLTDILCGVKINISPLSFYQVNRSTAEVLYRKAAELAKLRSDDILLDLYCGAGTIGLSMAIQVKELIGIEVIPQAIEDAKENARLNGFTNTRFFCGDAGTAATQLADEGISPTVVVVDPPRKGCDLAVIQAIQRMNPERVVMISCDSATMSRDLALFKEHGYHADQVTPVDMFPRTYHVENIVLLNRKDIDE